MAKLAQAVLESRRWLALAGLGVLGSCLQAPGYACESNDQCRIDDIQGECRPDTNSCIYPAGGCLSGIANGNGECLEPLTESTDDAAVDESPSDESSTTSGPSSSTESESDGDTTIDPEETSDDSTGTTEPCGGQIYDLVALGVVGASSQFNGDYPPTLSVDGNLATSWFSAGPESGGGPSLFEWSTSQARCIASVGISGNGLHANEDFRTDYGFEAVTVKIFDGSDDLVFQEDASLVGTPDPSVDIETGGVMGKRVVLELYDHEAPDCGGFAELKILGD